VFINVRVKERIPLDKLNGVQKKIDRVQNILGDNGRVLVRYSGTEPLLRIMLEGPDKKKLNSYSNEIASEVKKAGNYL
jgi:phosphoglucosamine mutase